MLKKITASMVILAMIFALAGCSSDEERPALAAAAIPDNAQEGTYNGFTASYDSEKWIFDSSVLNVFAIYDRETAAAGNQGTRCDYITVVDGGEYAEELTEDDMATIEAQLENEGAEIISDELMDFEGSTVIFYESRIELTDAMIDLYLDSGRITEVQIEEYGGRDELKANGSSSQMGMAAVVDGHFVMVTGTYYADPSEILPAILVLIQTGQFD